MDYIIGRLQSGEKCYINYGSIDYLIERENENCIIKASNTIFVTEYKTAEEVMKNWGRLKCQ